MLEEIEIEKYLESGKVERVICGGESGEEARVRLSLGASYPRPMRKKPCAVLLQANGRTVFDARKGILGSKKMADGTGTQSEYQPGVLALDGRIQHLITLGAGHFVQHALIAMRKHVQKNRIGHGSIQSDGV